MEVNMKAPLDPAHGSSSMTPRRRGAAQQSAQTSQSQSQSPSAKEETPVLLRLPDLHPSEAVDAAVRRIEKQVDKKAPGSANGDPKRQRWSPNRVTSERSPSPPTIKNASAMANWNNRIIVTTFVLTVLASGFMVIQRAARNRADEHGSTVPVSAQKDLEPIPSHRINRQSFQADLRSSDTGELNHKQSSNRPTNSTARMGSQSGFDAQYDAKQVSYETDVQAERTAPTENEMTDTYDLSLHSASKRDHNIDQPRDIRLRGK